MFQETQSIVFSLLAPSRGESVSGIKGLGNSGCIMAFCHCANNSKRLSSCQRLRLERYGRRNSELTENLDFTVISGLLPDCRLLDRAALKSHSCKDNWLVKATFFGH